MARIRISVVSYKGRSHLTQGRAIADLQLSIRRFRESEGNYGLAASTTSLTIVIASLIVI